MKKVVLFVLLIGFFSCIFLFPLEGKTLLNAPLISLTDLRFNYDYYYGKKAQLEGNYYPWHRDAGILISNVDDDAVIIWGKVAGFSPKAGERVKVEVEILKKDRSPRLKLLKGRVIEDEKVTYTGKIYLIGYQPFINLVLETPDGHIYVIKGRNHEPLKRDYIGKNVKVEGFIIKGDKIVKNGIEVTKYEVVENKK